MKLRFTIGRRIGIGFGVVIFFITLIFSVTIQNVISGLSIFEESKKLNDQITRVETPSVNLVIELSNLVQESKALITKWATEQSRDDNPDKLRLVTLMNKDIPRVSGQIREFTPNWPAEGSSNYRFCIQQY
jgi:hypothetical protein